MKLCIQVIAFVTYILAGKYLDDLNDSILNQNSTLKDSNIQRIQSMNQLIINKKRLDRAFLFSAKFREEFQRIMMDETRDCIILSIYISSSEIFS